MADLPQLPDHPEPRSFKWSQLETDAITAYGAACEKAARAPLLAEIERLKKVLEKRKTQIKWLKLRDADRVELLALLREAREFVNYWTAAPDEPDEVGKDIVRKIDAALAKAEKP